MAALAKPWRRWCVGLALAAPILLSSADAMATGQRQPVVVELFTSQGCSSCPPANANLSTVSGQPDVLALSYGVTYWDGLGWKDTFAKPEFTARQRTYEGPLGRSSPFTPQVVVDGRADTVGNVLASLDHLIAQSRGQDRGPDLLIRGKTVSIGAGTAPDGGADIWLVRYDPRVVEIPVLRGENRGRTLPHKNVVHDPMLIGSWTGEALDLPFDETGDGLHSTILVQGRRGGPILAAITN